MDTSLFRKHTEFRFLGIPIPHNKFFMFLLLLITAAAAIFGLFFLFLALDDYFNHSLIYVVGSFLTFNFATAIFKGFFSNRTIKYLISRLTGFFVFVGAFYYCYCHSLTSTNYIIAGLILFIFVDCLSFKKATSFFDLIK